MTHQGEPSTAGPGAAGHDPGTAKRHAAPRQQRALTLPARRLAGSPECLNCGTRLHGPFCYYCGQPDKNLLRFFPALLRDLLEDLIDFDSRFMRTLRPLLFHPGRLTRDYLDGKRFRYTPPLRLYIFSSMAFFILAAMLTGSIVDFANGPAEPGSGVVIRIGEDDDPGAASGFNLNLNGKRWDREANPLILPLMPDFINDWINDEISESPRKGREIEQNPNLMIEQLFDVLPVAIFIMLPLIALLFKLWYPFARRYYVEHLIHALHNHAFLFLVFTLLLCANSLAGWLDPQATGWQAKSARGLSVALWCWIPCYLLLSLKTVYRQGWVMTLTKFSLIGISYLVLLAVVTSLAAALSFLLL